MGASNSIWGARGQRYRDGRIICGEADVATDWLVTYAPRHFATIAELRLSFKEAARSYFALAALSRRRELEAGLRQESLARLFNMRKALEAAMMSALHFNADVLPVLREATRPSFFGVSKKQGVGIRYALSSCVPTKQCGGRCYAHDGRDRELMHVFRGVLNYYVGAMYEHVGDDERVSIITLLSSAIANAVSAARQEQAAALRDGYDRLPRIRFAHVGEMAATPNFTNALARAVVEQDPTIQCVVYTRHPSARLLDPAVCVVNFTLEGRADNRIAFAPATARIVNSAWDGEVSASAEVNFLEHHVEKTCQPRGAANICPVTVDHVSAPSCDAARCQKCFVPVISADAQR